MATSARELLRSTHLSYSKLQTYLKCPHRFKLEYLDKCRVEPSREIQLGSVVHAIIARYLLGIQGQARTFETNAAELVRLLPVVTKQLQGEGELSEKFGEDEVYSLLEGFADGMPRIDGRAIIHVESEKHTKLGGYVLKSILDLVLTDGRRQLHIIDFKTGKPQYVKDEQLRTYALPVLGSPDHGGSPVKLSYLFLRDGLVRSMMMTREECDGVVARIMEVVRTIEADETFRPKVTRLCDWCGVRHACSAYKNRF